MPLIDFIFFIGTIYLIQEVLQCSKSYEIHLMNEISSVALYNFDFID